MRCYSKEEILQILRRHNTVKVAYSEEDRKRALENPVLEEFRAGLLETSEKMKKIPAEPLPFSLFRTFEEDGNRKPYETLYFVPRDKLLVFTLEYWLYRNDDTLVHLQDAIWAILNEYTWCLPAHFKYKGLSVIQSEKTHTVDLFAAETAQALSEVLALVGDALHPIIKERIHYEIERRVLSRVYQEGGDKFWWYEATNNWSAVCGGSVGMTALYEIEDEERLAFYLESVLKTLQYFENGFPPDGACLEGLGYWNYGFGYFMCFADMLARRTEGEINLFEDVHIKNIAFFGTKTFFKGGRTVSFSDATSREKRSLLSLSILSKYYDDYKIPKPEFISFAYSNGRFAFVLRSLVCARPDIKSVGEEIVGTYMLPDAGWYIASSEDGVGIAAKAGHNSEPHNHNDIGSFLVYKNGESIISDIGSGEYTRQYFSEERYEIFCNSSASHSVPVINGEFQMSGKDFKASDVKMSVNGFSANIAGAYAVKTLKSLKREIAFDTERSEISVFDKFDFDEIPASVVERFISSNEPQILADRVVVGAKNEKMAIYFEADKWDASINAVVDKDHGAHVRTTYTIDFALKKLDKTIDAKFMIK